MSQGSAKPGKSFQNKSKRFCAISMNRSRFRDDDYQTRSISMWVGRAYTFAVKTLGYFGNNLEIHPRLQFMQSSFQLIDNSTMILNYQEIEELTCAFETKIMAAIRQSCKKLYEDSDSRIPFRRNEPASGIVPAYSGQWLIVWFRNFEIAWPVHTRI